MKYLIPLLLICLFSCESPSTESESNLRLWYDEPAQEWTEALPLGNGRIGAMVFGGTDLERIQFNEETLWTGEPRDYSREGASAYLDEIRHLLAEGRQAEAEKLAGEQFMGIMSNEEDYPEQLNQWLSEVQNPEKPAFTSIDFDDSEWKSMNLPTIEGWEESGLDGIDGCVWFRYSFNLPESWRGKDLILNLGRIRDTDYTYLNGKLVGSSEERFHRRRYPVSRNDLNVGKNVIAVQVLNFYDDGGFIGFKDDEPMVVYPKGGDFSKGIPLNVDWKYKIDNSTPPEYPRYEATYQPFGDIWFEFPGHENATNYTRTLDLNRAISTVNYSVDGVDFTREYFISEPDQALIVKISSSEKGALNFTASLTSPHANHQVRETEDGFLKLNSHVTNGALQGVSYLKAETKGGQSSIVNGRISIKNANDAIFYLTAATNYVRYDDVSGDADELAKRDLTEISGKSYRELLNSHITDYRKYFDRFSIDLGSYDRDSLTTDVRIQEFATTSDPALLALYVQYGRYLMISSSRPGTRPANLQGIWNDQLTPPWDSKYTTNINLEMNYWPAEPLNLSEMHEPLFQMVEEIANKGKKTAKDHYNANGWVLHHNTDLWRATAPINNPNHGIWVTGGAWLCHHLWEHFEFTGDTTFLRERAYPIMKGAAEFFVDFLVEDPTTGFLISTPSNSPENGGLVAAPTMDHQIIRDLFVNCIKAIEIMGTDSDFAETLENMLPHIAPNKIGKHGQLQEWLEDIDDPENKHRHVSHLWGVYPGNEINMTTPDLLNAAKQSLIFRGDEGTGWSLAWKINLWARFRDGNHSWLLIKELLSPAWVERESRGGSYKNLFDAHPPFQIDGNFGAAAGIAEMIIQSQGDEIVLLPALPDAIPDGKIAGLKARGGLELSIEWKDGQLSSLQVETSKPITKIFTYNNKSIDIQLTPSLVKQIGPQDFM